MDTELATAEWQDVPATAESRRQHHRLYRRGIPLLRGDLPELVRHTRCLGLESILFTSGARVTPAQMAGLKKAGLWACCVSLTDNAEDHDRMRGILAYLRRR